MNFVLSCCRLSVGCGVCVRAEGPLQPPAPLLLHSHFPNLFAIVAQDLEESIQDLRQIIQQVNVWHGLQNQDLPQGRKPSGKVTSQRTCISSPILWTGQREGALLRHLFTALRCPMGEQVLVAVVSVQWSGERQFNPRAVQMPGGGAGGVGGNPWERWARLEEV